MEKLTARFRIARVVRSVCLLIVVVLLLTVNGVHAAPVAPFLDQTVVVGLTNPSSMTFSPDGRLFVTEQNGLVRLIDNGVLAPAPFLTIPAGQIDVNNERGLIGLAFDPNYLVNGHFYVFYTNRFPANHSRVSRFTATGTPATATTADFATEFVLIDMPATGAATQNQGGSMHFAPDGTLFIAVGDNEDNNPGISAQDPTSLFGKILRLNSDGSIPADNPFVGNAGVRDEIWALGFRNPFSFAFQPITGRMYINDVGEAGWEEVNQGVAGGNYGWPYREADDPGVNAGEPIGFTYISPMTPPTYGYGAGGSCAITGSTFNNGTQFPGFDGHYFFGDFCGGWIQAFNPDTPAVPPVEIANGLGFGVIDLDMAPNTELYYLSRFGEVHRIYNPNPIIAQGPTSVTVSEGQSASFSCSATGEAPLTFQWERDGVAIAGATGASYTLASTTSADNGVSFRCRVSSPSYPDALSNPALLTVTHTVAQIDVFDPAISKLGFLLPGELGAQNETIEWVVTVTNTSDTRGNNVVITDNLRDELRIDRVSASGATVDVTGQTVTVTYATLAPNESVRFSIFTTVISGGAQVDNTACVTADNASGEDCVTALAVQTLPATGETPWWRVYMVMAIGVMVMLVFGAVMLLMVIDVAMPVSDHPETWA